MDDGAHSAIERELFFRVIFPYASEAVLSEASFSDDKIEDCLHSIHAATNPDVYSAYFLCLEQEREKEENDASNSASEHLPFSALPQILKERSALLEEQLLPSASLNYEYMDTVAGFPIDTSAWDDRNLNAASVADVMGASAFLLSANDSATQALVPKWPAEPSRARERDGLCSQLFKDVLPLFAVSADEAMEETHRIYEELVKTSGGLSSVLDFGLQMERQWSAMMKELEPWANVFSNNQRCALSREITERCPKLADVLPSVVPKCMRVLERELKGYQIASPGRDFYIDALGGYLLDYDSIKISELIFGRSYVRFVDDGTALVLRVKIKRIAFEPVLFSYRKVQSNGSASSGNMKMNVKDVIVKMKGDCFLSPSGQITIYSKKSNVSIGALNTLFSLTKLNIIATLLKPTIRSKVRKALKNFLSGNVALGPN